MITNNLIREKGIMLLELLLTIGIIIVITSVMVFAIYSKISGSSKENMALQDMMKIVAAGQLALQSNKEACTAPMGSPDRKKCGLLSEHEGGPSGEEQRFAWLAHYQLESRLASNPLTANPWGGNYEVRFSSSHPNYIEVGIGRLPASVLKENQLNSLIHSMNQRGGPSCQESGDQTALRCYAESGI